MFIEYDIEIKDDPDRASYIKRLSRTQLTFLNLYLYASGGPVSFSGIPQYFGTGFRNGGKKMPNAKKNRRPSARLHFVKVLCAARKPTYIFFTSCAQNPSGRPYQPHSSIFCCPTRPRLFYTYILYNCPENIATLSQHLAIEGKL